MEKYINSNNNIIIYSSLSLNKSCRDLTSPSAYSLSPTLAGLGRLATQPAPPSTRGLPSDSSHSPPDPRFLLPTPLCESTSQNGTFFSFMFLFHTQSISINALLGLGLRDSCQSTFDSSMSQLCGGFCLVRHEHVRLGCCVRVW